MENAYLKKLNEIKKLNKKTNLLDVCSEALLLAMRNNNDNLLKRAMPSESYIYIEERGKIINIAFKYKKTNVFCLDSVVRQNNELEIVNQIRNRFEEILIELHIKHKFKPVDYKMINWFGGEIIIENERKKNEENTK